MHGTLFCGLSKGVSANARVREHTHTEAYLSFPQAQKNIVSACVGMSVETVPVLIYNN